MSTSHSFVRILVQSQASGHSLLVTCDIARRLKSAHRRSTSISNRVPDIVASLNIECWNVDACMNIARSRSAASKLTRCPCTYSDYMRLIAEGDRAIRPSTTQTRMTRVWADAARSRSRAHPRAEIRPFKLDCAHVRVVQCTALKRSFGQVGHEEVRAGEVEAFRGGEGELSAGEVGTEPRRLRRRAVVVRGGGHEV